MAPDWDQAGWAILAIIVWALYQTRPYKILRARIGNSVKDKIGPRYSGILTNWLFWTVIPIAILLLHGSIGRMRIRPPIPTTSTIALCLLLFAVVYVWGLAEFYTRCRAMKDLASAKRVVAWTEDFSWTHGILGGLTQNIPEETFYRGYLLAETCAVSPVLGYAFSSLVFGLLHTYWDRWKILTTTISGLVFAYLFIQTNSIVPPITVHIATNLLIIPPARHWSHSLLESSTES